MTGVELVALGLLIIRVVASAYLIKVVLVQRKLLKLPAVNEQGEVDEEVMHFRKILHRMTLVVLAGQAVPITIDALGAFTPHLSPPWLIFVYAISNAITALTAAVLIWKLYQMAVNIKEVNDLERKHVQTRHEQELKDKS